METTLAPPRHVPEIPTAGDAPGLGGPGQAGFDLSGEFGIAGLAWSGTLPTLILLVVFNLAVVTRHVVIDSRMVALALGVVLPGATVMRAVRLRLANPFAHFVAVVAAGAAVWMAWVTLSGFLLHAVGVKVPWATWWLTTGIDIIVIVALVLRPQGSDPILELIPRPTLRPSVVVALVGTLLPLGAVGAAIRLNNGLGGSAAVAISCAGLAMVVGVLIACPSWSDGRTQFLLWSVALTFIYLFTFRSNHLFGYDVQQEFQRFSSTLATGRWLPPSNGDPYSSMLSITALPAGLAKVTGLSGITLFKVIYPMALATVPGLLFALVRNWLSVRMSAVVAAYLVVLSQFAGQLSGISRQEFGLCYLGLLLVVLFDPGLGHRQRSGAALAILAALVVSHYSTSYVAVVSLLVTWAIFGLVGQYRKRSGRPTEKARITSVVALSGVAMVWLWDVAITRSAHNLTSFVASFVEKGPALLPNASGSNSIVTAWLNGNVGQSVSPTTYYALASRAAEAERWLHRYPNAVTDRFPAHAVAAAAVTSTPQPFVSGLVLAVVAQVFLLATVVGVIFIVLRNRRSGIPLEYAVLSLVTLGFVGLVRVSGSIASSYNQERAQVQAVMVLAVPLAIILERLARRTAGVSTWAAVGGILVLGLGSTGLIRADKPTLSNTGRTYDQFYVTDQDAAAAQWMVQAGGSHPILWTDEYGVLRVWAATPHAAATHQDLTPATIDRAAWVLATTYNVEGRTYGRSGNKSATYRFPSDFLSTVKNTVYSSPEARVYK